MTELSPRVSKRKGKGGGCPGIRAGLVAACGGAGPSRFLGDLSEGDWKNFDSGEAAML